ncbi:recombinase family protein [Acetobacterium sp.]|uniref:recombinase family protein n=1 Tax=Acetobacterium sp. TaxID=1872094 RepID=UPI00271E2F91|nr:recombinase family protein [Acetobacterium sp.]MDO9491259.1 recombinase family protein [Acetobacterium sp.]
MIFGYTRVSKTEQNLDRQIDQLKDIGCEKIFQDKITGMTMDRPELNKMFEYLRLGDTIMVTELSRFGRSVKDLLELVDRIEMQGANLKSLKEPWADTTTPQGRMLFVVFAGIGQFERDLISQRTKEGLASARARGRKGGRPRLPADKINLALKMYGSKDYSIAEITEATGVSKKSIYRYVEQQKSKTAATENISMEEKL